MSHVTFTEVLANAVASAADVNSTLTSWNTKSTDVDGDNVREEGLDSRSLEVGSVVPRNGDGTFTNNSSASFTNTSEALASIGSDVICGPIVLDESDSEICVVRCSVRLRIVGQATAPGATQARVTIRLKYTTDSSPSGSSSWTTLTRTQRVFEFDDAQFTGTPPDERNTYAVTHRFDGPSAFSSSTLHFGLFAWISNGTGTYHLDRVSLGAITYAR